MPFNLLEENFDLMDILAHIFQGVAYLAGTILNRDKLLPQAISLPGSLIQPGDYSLEILVEAVGLRLEIPVEAVGLKLKMIF